MYLDHFGLHSQPFALTPDTSRFFADGGRMALLEQLSAAIQAGEGVIQVIGGSGSGKTMLCRALCERLPSGIRIALLLNPALPPGDLIPALLNEFRLPTPGRKERLAARQLLLDYLVTINRNGERAVLLIDDAHAMPAATLESLRLLGNMETAQAKLLQVVLFAQPAFDTMLRDPALHPLRERIGTRLTLLPLSSRESDRYLQFRLQAAGFTGERLFTPRAARCLHRLSGGRIGRIHHLANRTMQRAHQDGSTQVSARHALGAAATDLPRFRLLPACLDQPVLATAALAAMLVGGGVWHSWATGPDHDPARNPSPTHVSATNRNTPTPEVAAEPEKKPSVADHSLAPAPQTRAEAPAEPSPVETEESAIQFPDERLFLADQEADSHNSAALPVQRTPLGKPYLKPDDPLAEAILASHRWLDTGNEKNYSIQLILLRSESGLEVLIRQLAAIHSPPEALDLKLFRLKDDTLLIYLNECHSLVACEALLNRLPVTLRAGKPGIRSLARMKTTVRKLAIAATDHTG
ncbi:MAG: AAA family ATPase [Magnetococcales bacterium]|nr:AAA family ATPase [Magnetococcales bacterium]